MIIGICGKIGCGKTTVSNFLVENYNFSEYSFAQPLKEIAKIFGFTDKQVYGTQTDKLEIHPVWGVSAREFLQKVGTDLFRDRLKTVLPEMKVDSSIWIDLFKIKYGEDKSKNYVVSDVRFLDEYKAIKNLGGFVIKIVRDEGTSTHASETEMDSIPADYIIINREITLQQLYENIIRILKLHFDPLYL